MKKAEEKKKKLAQNEVKVPVNVTTEQVLESALSWNNFQTISNKLSIGTTATSKYHDRAQVF